MKFLLSVGGIQENPERSRRQAGGGGLHRHMVRSLQADRPQV